MQGRNLLVKDIPLFIETSMALTHDFKHLLMGYLSILCQIGQNLQEGQCPACITISRLARSRLPRTGLKICSPRSSVPL